MNLTFAVDGMPQTKGSWRVIMRRGRPVLIPDNDAEPAWAQLVGWAARAKLRNVIAPSAARFVASLAFTLPPRKGRKSNKRDLDKLARSVLDALTKLVWIDDEQVDELHLYKRIGEPGATITIEERAPMNIQDQPPPIERPDQHPVWELVVADALGRFGDRRSGPDLIADMVARDKVGRERYGTPLTTGNGRDQLVDAYQETLDQCVYLRAAIEERLAANVEGSMPVTTHLRALYADALQIAYDLRDILSQRS